MAELSQINANVAHKPTLVLYFRRSVEEAMQRIRRRGREFEKDITEKYLQELDSLYEELYKDREDVIKIDSNMPVDEIKREVLDKLQYKKAKYHGVFEGKGFSEAEAKELLMQMIRCFGNRLEPTLEHPSTLPSMSNLGIVQGKRRVVLLLQKVSGDELEIQMRGDQSVQELKKALAKMRKSTCNRHRLIAKNKD